MSVPASPTYKSSVPLADTSVRTVSCFNDRAEVTRAVSLASLSSGAGLYEVCVEGLTAKADPDSIRVKAAEGSKVTIVEVAFEVHTKLADPTSTDPGPGGIDARRSELSSLTAAHRAVSKELDRAKQGRELVDGYVKGMLQPPASGVTTPPPDIGTVEQLLSFHASRSSTSDAEVLRLEEELKTASTAVEVATTALAKLENPMKPRTVKSRDVTVLVQVHEEAAKAGAVTLLLTYMVEGASWSPSYDIRVDTTAEKAKAGGELSLSYFGLVRNGTGEDWAGCRLSLSTAKPSKAGMPPAPPRRMLRWQQEVPLLGGRGVSSSAARRARDGPPPGAIPMQACMSSNAMMPMRERNLSCNALELDDVEDYDDDEADGFVPPSVAQSTVSEGGGGTAAFVIEREVTIEADSKPHKVTIALLSFEPQLLYFATPSLESAFYLQVKAKNTSSFPLLASAQVSVFLDGSFVTQTQLKDVSPSEEFTTFLGADASLKLVHQQLARERKTAGTFQKTQTTSHRFVSKLHNTKAVPARVTVVEVLPKSTEDKIKVELVAPSSRELREEGAASAVDTAPVVMQNKVTNNIVYQLTLAPGAKKDLAFEYSVSWPSDKQISSYDYQG